MNKFSNFKGKFIKNFEKKKFLIGVFLFRCPQIICYWDNFIGWYKTENAYYSNFSRDNLMVNRNILRNQQQFQINSSNSLDDEKTSCPVTRGSGGYLIKMTDWNCCSGGKPVEIFFNVRQSLQVATQNKMRRKNCY